MTSKIRHFVRRLRGDREGLAFLEFALALPPLMLALLGGLELIKISLVHQQLSATSTQVADLAARYQDGIDESDVNTLFYGTLLSMKIDDFTTNGRIILSAMSENSDVEADGVTPRTQDGQWIRWQRCEGSNAFTSAFGTEGTGRYDNALPNVDGFTAIDPNTVIVAEVYYNYSPRDGNAVAKILRPIASVFQDRTIRYRSVFIARELELTSVSNDTATTSKTC